MENLLSDRLNAIFAEAKARQNGIHKSWVDISHKIGGLLPTSLMAVSIQQNGDLDVLLRSLEDDKSLGKSTETSDLFSLHYQNLLTGYWVGSVYEILRTLKAKKLISFDEGLLLLFRHFELVRMTLEKYEIAKDSALTEPLKFMPFPPKAGDDVYIYDRSDLKRAHIMHTHLSLKGSISWTALDIKQGAYIVIERRSLSDAIIERWA